MIEGEGDFLTEAQMVGAVQAAHDAVKKICAAIGELAEKTGRPKVLNTLQVIPPELKEKLNAAVGDGVASMLKMTDPEAGGVDTFVARAEMKSLTAQAIDGFAEEYGTNVVKVAFKKVREMSAAQNRRPAYQDVPARFPPSTVCPALQHEDARDGTRHGPAVRRARRRRGAPHQH